MMHPGFSRWLSWTFMLGWWSGLAGQPAVSFDWARGDSLIRAGAFEPALAHYGEGLALAQAAADPVAIFTGYFSLGRGYLGVPDYALAEAYLDSARTWAGHHPEVDFPLMGQLYYYLGYLYDDIGRYAAADSHQRLAIQLFAAQTPLDSTGYANALNALGVITLHAGRADSARHYLGQSLALRQRLGNPIHTGQVVMNLGNATQTLGLWDEAQAYYREALDLFTTALGPSHYFVAVTYENLGMTHYGAGDYARASDYLNQARYLLWDLFGQSHPNLINLYNNLGALYIANGEVAAAQRYLLAAEELIKRHLGPDHPALCRLYNNLALIATETDWPQAERYFAEGRRVWALAFDHPNSELTELYGAQAQGLMGRGAYREALRYYQLTLAAGEAIAGENFFLRPTLYREMAETYRRMGRYDSAYTYAQYAIATQVPLPTGSGLPPLPALRQLWQVNELIFGLVERAQALAHWGPAGVPEPQVALAHILLAADLLDSLRVDGNRFQEQTVDKLPALFDFGIQLAWQLWEGSQDPAYQATAFRLAEQRKSASLHLALSLSQAKAFGGIPERVLREERSLNQRIAHLRQQIQTEREAGFAADSSALNRWASALLTLRQAKDALVQRLEQQYPAYYQLRYETRVADLGQVQSQLQPGQAMASYYWGDSLAWLWTLTADSITWTQLPDPRRTTEKLTQWLAAFRADTSGDPAEAWRHFAEQGYALYQRLLTPGRYLEREQLVIIPDGPLEQLPFALLLTAPPAEAQSGRYDGLAYLLRDRSVSYAYSARLWEAPLVKAPLPGRGYAGFAPAYAADLGERPAVREAMRSLKANQAFAPLVHNQPEVAAVARLLEGTAFLGDSATEAAFKAQAPHYGLLHLAMHAFTDPERPGRSGMIFAHRNPPGDSLPQREGDDWGDDGVLYAYEIYELVLPAHLAVLSACNTGIGKALKGEGLMSLARAFAYAGCHNLVPTLWPVDDAATRELVEPFFAALQAGAQPSRALRQSQLAYARRYPQAHPRYWGGMVVIGSDTPLPRSFPAWPYLAGLLVVALALGLIWWRRRGRRRDPQGLAS